ncbi:MAG: hypothetical protein AAF705_12515 [Bacteroidota bacterium]
MNRFTFLLLCLLLSFGCDKPTIEGPIPNLNQRIFGWTNTQVRLEGFLVNSYANQSQLHILTSKSLITFQENGTNNEALDVEDFNLKPAPYLDGNHLVVVRQFSRPLKDSIVYDIHFINDDFSKVSFALDSIGYDYVPDLQCAVINEANEIAFVFRDYLNDAVPILVAEIDQDEQRLKNFNLFNLPPEAGTAFKFFTHFQGDFYLSGFDNTYRFDHQGNFEKIGNYSINSAPFEISGFNYMDTDEGILVFDAQLGWQVNLNQLDDLRNIPLNVLGTLREEHLVYFRHEQRYWWRPAIRISSGFENSDTLRLDRDYSNLEMAKLHIFGARLYGLSNEDGSSHVYQIDLANY